MHSSEHIWYLPQHRKRDCNQGIVTVRNTEYNAQWGPKEGGVDPSWSELTQNRNLINGKYQAVIAIMDSINPYRIKRTKSISKLC